MYKQSSGRNNRSKGFKIKHIIQLFVLVAICVWLIYQVKHSHDKKREFEEKNIKTPSSLSNGAGDEVIKFGRKDVEARFEKTTLVTDGKVEEAEGGGDQEDNTIEEDEQEEDIKHEEQEEEGRGGGDDEIDENNQHKFDMELERAEGKDIEEVERSDRENSEDVERSDRENSEDVERSRRENSEEGQSERENSEEVERLDRENFEEGQREIENSGEGQRETENSGEGQREREEDHEAREEHYKADDASSAVAHETESESLEKLNESSEDESSNNAKEVNAGRQNYGQGNQTVGGNDIPQNYVTAANGRSSLNSTTTKVEKSSGLEDGNDPSLNQIPEKEDEERGPPSAFYTSPVSFDLKTINNFTIQLEDERTEETSQNIAHERASKRNTTFGAEIDHSGAVEGEVAVAAAGAGKQTSQGLSLNDPNSDSSLSDPIDSLDSSSSHLESSSDVHDHVGIDSIIRTTEGNGNLEDDAITTA